MRLQPQRLVIEAEFDHVTTWITVWAATSVGCICAGQIDIERSEVA